MKILSRGGNWQTGLASRTILLQLFCDCPTVAPLHSVVHTLVNIFTVEGYDKSNYTRSLTRVFYKVLQKSAGTNPQHLL